MVTRHTKTIETYVKTDAWAEALQLGLACRTQARQARQVISLTRKSRRNIGTKHEAGSKEPRNKYSYKRENYISFAYSKSECSIIPLEKRTK